MKTDQFEKENPKFLIHEQFATDLEEFIPEYAGLIQGKTFKTFQEISDYDFLFSFGGDGTFLNALRYAIPAQIPVLGVNSGRLGFLTGVSQDGIIGAFKEIKKNMYRIELRVGMSVESNPPGLFSGQNFGLNDLTIHKSTTNEMITVHTYINGEFLNSYWGDGLIISTPTGSTAYSLSCGGPIILPTAKSFVITPVAPHSLTVRPLIIPDDVVVSFEIESRAGQAMVALDTRTELINQRTEIALRRAEHPVKLVRLSSSNYLGNLRDRLMWGKDSRN